MAVELTDPIFLVLVAVVLFFFLLFLLLRRTLLGFREGYEERRNR